MKDSDDTSEGRVTSAATGSKFPLQCSHKPVAQAASLHRQGYFNACSSIGRKVNIIHNN